VYVGLCCSSSYASHRAFIDSSSGNPSYRDAEQQTLPFRWSSVRSEKSRRAGTAHALKRYPGATAAIQFRRERETELTFFASSKLPVAVKQHALDRTSNDSILPAPSGSDGVYGCRPPAGPEETGFGYVPISRLLSVRGSAARRWDRPPSTTTLSRLLLLASGGSLTWDNSIAGTKEIPATRLAQPGRPEMPSRLGPRLDAGNPASPRRAADSATDPSPEMRGRHAGGALRASPARARPDEAERSRDEVSVVQYGASPFAPRWRA